MSKIRKLFAESAASKIAEKNWSTVAIRVNMRTKAELTKLAAEEGLNMNRFLKDCILYKCEGNTSAQQDNRVDEEKEQLHLDILASENKCKQLEDENSQLKLQLSSVSECSNNFMGQQAEKIADLQSAMESNNKYILQLKKEKEKLNVDIEKIADETVNIILTKTGELEAEVERMKGIEIENESLKKQIQKISTEKEVLEKVNNSIDVEWEKQKKQIAALRKKNTKLRKMTYTYPYEGGEYDIYGFDEKRFFFRDNSYNEYVFYFEIGKPFSFTDFKKQTIEKEPKVGSIILVDGKRYKLVAMTKDSFKAIDDNGDIRTNGVLFEK